MTRFERINEILKNMDTFGNSDIAEILDEYEEEEEEE